MKRLTTLFLTALFLLLFSTGVAAWDFDDGAWVVKLKDQLSDKQAARLAETNDLGEGMDGYYIVDEETALAMAGQDEVEYIEESGVATLSAAPNDTDYAKQWALLDLNWENARAITTGDGAIKIAIIDDGLYYNHDDIASSRLYARYQFINGQKEADANPSGNHGTHVTGIIAATVNNNRGIAGATENVKIGVYHAFMGKETYNAFIAMAIRAAADDGADIINMSFGSYVNDRVLREAVEYAAAKDVIMVAAVGNDGDKTIGSKLQYPAAYSGVIGVGAHDENRNAAKYSQTNSSVFVSAPGSSIYSLGDVVSNVSKYRYSSGTSMATPYVAALAALALSVDSNLTASEFKGLLRETATDLGAAGYDTSSGWGAIDYYALLAKVAGIDQALSRVAFSDASKADLIIPGTVSGSSDDVQRTLTPVLYDSQGVVINTPYTATWELVSLVDSTGISLNGNVLTVTNQAAPQTITLRVTVEDHYGNQATTTGDIVLKKESQVTLLQLVEKSFNLPAKDEGDVTYQLRCIGTDQYGNEISPSSTEISWELVNSADLVGLYLNKETGQLTVNCGARFNATARLRFTIGGTTFAETLTLTTAASQWQTAIVGANYVVPGTEQTYQCGVTDQYGNAGATAADYQWEIVNGDGVSIERDSGLLRVPAGTATQLISIKATQTADSSITATMQVAVVDAYPSDTTITSAQGWFSYLRDGQNTLVNVNATAVTTALKNGVFDGFDLTGIAGNTFTIAISGDVFNVAKQNNVSLIFDTKLGKLTLSKDIVNDIILSSLSYDNTSNAGDPAALQLSLTIARETISKFGERAGVSLSQTGLRLNLAINGRTAVTTTTTINDLALPVSTAYTTLVRIQDDGSLITVPTMRDQGNQRAQAVIKEFGFYTDANRTVSFRDVAADHWARQNIYDMAERLVIDGMTATTYQPEAKITRAQFCTLVVRGLGITPAGGYSYFTDVDATAWYAPYINVAFEEELVQGTGSNHFSPESNITRQEAILLLTRAFAFVDQTVAPLSQTQVNTILNRFTDQAEIDSWARYEVAQGIDNNLAEGYRDQTLRPLRNLSRAEGATIIRNFLIATDLIDS